MNRKQRFHAGWKRLSTAGMLERFRLLAVLIYYALVLYAGLLLFSVNYAPILPGLDSSWAFAVNYFAHGPEIFGRDLILTYGPLAYLVVPEHVGKNLELSVMFHVAIWSVLIYLLVVLWKSDQRVGATFFVLGLIAANRLYYFYYDYLLNVVAILALTLLLRKPESISLLIILAVMIGLSFLVKFTAFILVMLLLGTYLVFRLPKWRQTGTRERAALGLAAVSGPIAYLIYNPSLSGLIGYTQGSLSISTGYSAVMSYAPSAESAGKALVLCVVLGGCIAISLWQRWITPASAVMVVAVVWVAFKHGYVRSDPWHGPIFFCLIILAMSFFLVQQSYTWTRAAVFLVIFVAFSSFALSNVNAIWPVSFVFWWSPRLNLSQAAQLMDWQQTTNLLDQQSTDGFQKSIINHFEGTIGTSRVLFFPWDVSYGAHRKFTTVPLYATQAYSAYTHLLDDQSARHLSNGSPPAEYVLWEQKSIDSRSPILDTPATWNILYADFAPVSTQGDAILVKRRPAPLPIEFKEVGREGCRIEEWITVPPRTSPLALSLSIPATFTGKLWTALYQLGPVYLEVETKSGRQAKIRVPPDVVSYPFPLNYLPLDAPGVDALWTLNRALDPVVRFRLTGPGLEHLRCDGIRYYSVSGTAIVIG